MGEVPGEEGGFVVGEDPAFGLPNGSDGDGLAKDITDPAPLGFG